MSYQEAVEDGIPIKKSNGNGVGGYFPPCYYCGQPVFSWAYVRGVKYACPDCRAEVIRQKCEEKSGRAALGKERKLECAIRRISRVTDIEPYDKAIDYVRKHLKHQGWFQSTEEIMVALELIRRNINTHHQVKVFDYTVDFVLPDMKVILEIDGPIYHGKERAKYQARRDEVICWKFGEGWELIRIKTDYINMNITKLIPAIKKVLRYRQKNAH